LFLDFLGDEFEDLMEQEHVKKAKKKRRKKGEVAPRLVNKKPAVKKKAEKKKKKKKEKEAAKRKKAPVDIAEDKKKSKKPKKSKISPMWLTAANVRPFGPAFAVPMNDAHPKLTVTLCDPNVSADGVHSYANMTFDPTKEVPVHVRLNGSTDTARAAFVLEGSAALDYSKCRPRDSVRQTLVVSERAQEYHMFLAKGSDMSKIVAQSWKRKKTLKKNKQKK
jgi:hypothetical protein